MLWLDNKFKNKNTAIAPSVDCLHGGYQVKDQLKCTCPPGFQGTFCEKGNLI